MKTEINLESKAKFFAHYVWQRVWIKPSVYGYGTFSVNPQMLYAPSSEEYLELNPLSSITDEDANEVVETVKSMGMVSSAMREPKSYCINSIGKTLFNVSDVVDYLRSRGYALPWMGLYVEEMVEAGWIKLQED